MVTGVNASMPTGALTVGAAAPAQHPPQEAAVQPPAAQATPSPPPQTQTPAAVAATTLVAEAPALPRRSSENRRSNKPIMEKRRRARINNCLNDLKALILDAMKKDPARHSKLEKADILEMTVKHLESLQRQQVALASATDPSVLNKFRAGFSECASEVGRFPGLEASVKRRLMSHLATCLAADSNGSASAAALQQSAQAAQTTTTQLQVHILPQVDSASTIQVQQSNGIVYMNANGTALQLVPTRLPNGNIALVAAGPKSTTGASSSAASSPASSPAPSASPLPTLIPIPQRPASAASASSSSSSTSSTSTSAGSPVAFESAPAGFREQSQSPVEFTGVSHRDVATSPATTAGYTSDPEFDPRVFSPPLQKPLSLVMRKSVIKDAIEEKCWRPW